MAVSKANIAIATQHLQPCGEYTCPVEYGFFLLYFILFASFLEEREQQVMSLADSNREQMTASYSAGSSRNLDVQSQYFPLPIEPR